MRSFQNLALVIALLAISSTNSGAQLKLPPSSGPPQWNGSPAHLPLGQGLSEQEIIDHAYTMPGVQALLQEAGHRGYTAMPQGNRAVFRKDPDAVMVFLPFDKPGFAAPTDHIGAPLIMVGTSARYGQPHTVMSLTLVLIHEVSGEIKTADSHPELFADWTVESSSQDSDGGGGGKITPAAPDPGQVTKCAALYYGCALIGNSTCVAAALVSYFPLPWQKVLQASICIAGVTSACIWEFVYCVAP